MKTCPPASIPTATPDSDESGWLPYASPLTPVVASASKTERQCRRDGDCLHGRQKAVQALGCFHATLHARQNRIMSPEVSDLLKRALALPVDERAALANTLLDSLDTQNQSVEEAWDEEVARRMEALKAGKAVTVPWEELHRELLAMVNHR
jgi:putative addiction module component (TIGR02574 family)